MSEYTNIFHNIIMDRKTHRVSTTDAETFTYIDNDIYSPFDIYLSKEDQAVFGKAVADDDGSWFPLTIGHDEHAVRVYARITPADSDAVIQLTTVKLETAMDSYEEMIRTVESHRAVFDLYENVTFEYEPEKDTVVLMNTREAAFDGGEYTLGELKDILLKRADGESAEQVHEFIRMVEGRARNFRVRIDSNVLNDDGRISATMMTGTSVHHDSAQDGVVGFMHPVMDRGMGVEERTSRDTLTGLLSRKDILNKATERIDDHHIRNEALVIFDVDYFKNVNDTYGHKQGDIVLREVAAILEHEIGEDGYVGRIGGDEMMAVIHGIDNEQKLRDYLREIKIRVNTSLIGMGPEEGKPLSLSMGAAVYPKDAGSYEDLFMVADAMLYIAKEKGRNRYVIYTPGKHQSVEEIRAGGMTGREAGGRGQKPHGEFITELLDKARYGQPIKLQKVLADYTDRFGIPNLMLFAGDRADFVTSFGPKAITDTGKAALLSELLDSREGSELLLSNDFLVVNQLISLPKDDWKLSQILERCEIEAFIKTEFKDRTGSRIVMLMTSVGRATLWNPQNFQYMRVFRDVLEQYDIKEGLVAAGK